MARCPFRFALISGQPAGWDEEEDDDDDKSGGERDGAEAANRAVGVAGAGWSDYDGLE